MLPMTRSLDTMRKGIMAADAVLWVVLLLASVVHLPAGASSLPLRRYDSIFVFGDSYHDTGNGAVVFAAQSLPSPASNPPFGMTFFRRPTGRYSDGRLIIDFIAAKLGLPFVPPFLAHNGSFRQGANFAVAAATVLDAGFFAGIPGVVPNTSWSVQLPWFESLKPSLCSSAQECKFFFSNSLFFMGEFGINDYSFFFSGKTLPQARSIVPDVVKNISAATQKLIDHGAKTVVVPGIQPLGCLPPNLALFPSNDSADYDKSTGCLRQFNELAIHHNSLLQESLKNVQKNNPDTHVVYADFYRPIIDMIEFPDKFGFTRSNVLRCCCGGGGKYNYNATAECGTPGATVCNDPSTYLFWEGHLTEAAHRYIAKDWLITIMASTIASHN